MRPSDSILAKCVEHLSPHLPLPRPLIGNLADKWPTAEEPFAEHDRVTAEIFAHLRPHVSEIRALDIGRHRLDTPEYEGVFRKVGRDWFGNLDSDALFDAHYVSAIPGNLLFTVPRAIFVEPLFLSRLWDPGALNNPRVSFAGVHRHCSDMSDSSESVAFVPCIGPAGTVTNNIPSLLIYAARPAMPVLFRAMLDHCQMTHYKIDNLNGYYASQT